MNRKAAFMGWAVLAWILPALVAGALGWPGLWGTGSAIGDYLLPFPVAGGALHLPSFVAVALALLTQPWPGRAGGLVRGLLAGGALGGLVLLLDLQGLWRLYAGGSGKIWQENPLGLFLLADCLLALCFAPALGVRAAHDATERRLSWALVVIVPLLLAALAWQADTRHKSILIYSGSRSGDARGDAQIYYYTRATPGSAAFLAALPEIIERHDPAQNINDDNIALYFFDDLAAAQHLDDQRASYTVCLHEQGTPRQEAPGRHDCFGTR